MTWLWLYLGAGWLENLVASGFEAVIRGACRVALGRWVEAGKLGGLDAHLDVTVPRVFVGCSGAAVRPLGGHRSHCGRRLVTRYVKSACFLTWRLTHGTTECCALGWL